MKNNFERRTLNGFEIMRWLVLPLSTFLLWVSLGPFGAWVVGDPAKDPFRVLPKAITVDPLDYRWPYYLAQAYWGMGKRREAKSYFSKSLRLNPLDSVVWSSLADLCLDEGRKEDALLALKNAASLDPSSAFIQWRVLVRLLAIDLPSARGIAQELVSRLLILEPSKRRNLFALGEMLAGGGGMEKLLPHDEGVWGAYLRWLIIRSEVERAMVVWREMGKWGWKDRRLFRGVVDGLIARGAVAQAWEVWREEFPQDPFIHNGGFERDLLGFGFGWRFNSRISGLKSWGFACREKVEGRRSLYLEFDGEHNPQVSWPRQLVYVGTPGTYRLSAYVRTEGVTGATGFSLSVWGKGFRAQCRELRGYNPWRWVQVEFQVQEPGPCWVALVRRATRKLNRFLGGKVWIDQVVLERLDEEGVSQGNPG